MSWIILAEEVGLSLWVLSGLPKEPAELSKREIVSILVVVFVLELGGERNRASCWYPNVRFPWR